MGQNGACPGAAGVIHFGKNESMKPERKTKLTPLVQPRAILRKVFWLVFLSSFCMYWVDNFGPGWNKKEKDDLISAPLGFITLRAVRVPEGVRLSWMDKAYEENTYVEIEKRHEGDSFIPLEKYGDFSQDSGVQSFSYVDSTQSQQEIIYRLKKVGRSGQVSHSLPVRVNPVEVAFDFSLSPNSRGDEVLVFIKKNKQARMIEFAVWDMEGFLIYEKTREINSGKSDLKLKTGHLDSGVYFVTTSENGLEKSGAQKFIIP